MSNLNISFMQLDDI